MSLQQLKEKACQLSVSDRLSLLSAIVQSLQSTPEIENCQYLIARPHPWRKQLYIKGCKLLASTIQSLANHRTLPFWFYPSRCFNAGLRTPQQIPEKS
jgi:hypothetical protein